MPEDVRSCGCNNNSSFGGIFDGFGGDSTVLFFIIVFLLLFTNFGVGFRG